MKIKKLTVEELNLLIHLLQEPMEVTSGKIYDIHDQGEIVPEYLVQEYNKYVDIWNKLLQMSCRKQKKKLFTRREDDLPF